MPHHLCYGPWKESGQPVPNWSISVDQQGGWWSWRSYGLYQGPQTACPVYLPYCCYKTPKVSGNTYSKSITSTPLMLEFERMVAVLCMVHDVDSLHAQIVDNELTFSTRMGTFYYLYYVLITSHLEKFSQSPRKHTQKDLFFSFQSDATTSNNSPARQFMYSTLSTSDQGHSLFQTSAICWWAYVVPILDATDLDKPIVIPSGLPTVQKDYPHFATQYHLTQSHWWLILLRVLWHSFITLDIEDFFSVLKLNFAFLPQKLSFPHSGNFVVFVQSL